MIEEIYFKLSARSPLFNSRSIEYYVGVDILIRSYGAGKVTGMKYIDAGERVDVTVQLDFKFPWAAKNFSGINGNMHKLMVETQNGVTVWMIEMVK